MNTGVHQWMKRLEEQRHQLVARRALADRFDTACPGHPVQDGQHKWRRKNAWYDKCRWCDATRDIVE